MTQELRNNIKLFLFGPAKTLSFLLSLPARHFCHQGLGCPCSDLAITDLTFIRANIYLGHVERDLKLISEPAYFIRVIIYPTALPHNIRKGHY
jgi:hypothetical protein